MFRKIIEPIGPGLEAEIAVAECRKRIRFLKRLLAVLMVLGVVGMVVIKIWPSLFGAIGTGLLRGLLAGVVMLGIGWIDECQRLKRLERLSERQV